MILNFFLAYCLIGIVLRTLRVLAIADRSTGAQAIRNVSAQLKPLGWIREIIHAALFEVPTFSLIVIGQMLIAAYGITCLLQLGVGALERAT